MPSLGGPQLPVELPIDLVDGAQQRIHPRFGVRQSLLLAGVTVQQRVSGAAVLEHFRKHRAQGLQIAGAIQLLAGHAYILADRAEIEGPGQDGRDQQAGHEDGELLPQLQAAEKGHAAIPVCSAAPERKAGLPLQQGYGAAEQTGIAA